MIWLPMTQSSERYNNSFGVGDIFSRKEDPKVEDISSGEELLNDSMNEFENEYNEFDNKYLTGLITEDGKLGKVDTSYESDTNNNELINIKRDVEVDFGSHGMIEAESHPSDFSDIKHTQKDKAVQEAEDIPMNNEDLDEAKDPQSQANPTIRPIRWDVPPPGLTIEQLLLPLPPIYHVAQIAVPHHLRGLLVGRGGHFLRKIAEESGATVSLAGPVYCTVQGSCEAVEVAIRIIQERLSGYSYESSSNPCTVN